MSLEASQPRGQAETKLVDLEIGNMPGVGFERIRREPNRNLQVTRLKGPVGLLFALALLAGGIGLAWVDCDLILSHRAMQSWQEVPAKISRRSSSRATTSRAPSAPWPSMHTPSTTSTTGRRG